MAFEGFDKASVDAVARSLYVGFRRDSGLEPDEWSTLAPSEQKLWRRVVRRAMRAFAKEIPRNDADYNSGSFPIHCAAVRRRATEQQRKLDARDTLACKSVLVDRDESIPPLAWLCSIDRDVHAFTIGRSVEHNEQRIVEGVWAGDFATTKIEESDCMFGSGAALGEQVVFVPPKHNYEHLFVLHDCALQRTYVANSLCFVLAAAGSEIEESFLALMPAGLLALGRLRPANIDFYDPLVCGNARFRLFKMMYYNFSADHAGVVKLHECRLHPPAGNFKEYRDHLSKQLGALFANARHPGRSTRFEPIATVSTGYDSVACAALAKEQGCVEALTLDVSVKGKDDHGGDVAASLGLRLISRRHVMGDDIANLRVEFSGHLQEAVAEFVATQGVGDDIAFQPFESCLSGRLLVTGGYGDTIWRRQPPTPPGLPTGTVFSKSITEFRLRVGFSYLPLPFIAARFPQAVNAISQSAEMQPFCLAQEYDRPIPRRIAEEAGVPREAFGQRKVATAPLPTNHQALFVASVRKVMNRYRQGIRRVPPPVAQRPA